MEILIDWQHIKSPEEFYGIFLPQVKAPDWHGHNLAALNDSIVTGDINEIEPPYLIKSINSAKAPYEMRSFQTSFFSILADAEKEERQINVLIL